MSAARQEFGEEGERVAERWLRRRGWRVLQRRFRNGHRDIGLGAEKDGTGAFVGGKGRRGYQFGGPVEGGGRRKQGGPARPAAGGGGRHRGPGGSYRVAGGGGRL